MRRLLPCLFSTCLLQSGCSLFSSVPLWELAKAGGSLATSAITLGPSSASRTVFHPHRPVTEVCIEFNRASQSPELVPALQAELQRNGVNSRVYEQGVLVGGCEFWLHYAAQIEWAVPPMGSAYRQYLISASLALRDRDGKIVSASDYQLDGLLGMGKWSETRAKLAPVVLALLNGSDD